jgi:DNA-binding beta-propeller fold protein YncE
MIALPRSLSSLALALWSLDNHLVVAVVYEGNVLTLAGVGSTGSTNGIGTNSQFFAPRGVSLSSDGTYALVADTYNNLIRQIALTTAAVTTLAGASQGSTDGLGTNSQFYYPRGVSVSTDGTFALVADTNNQLIRQIVIATAAVTTLAGDLAGLSTGSSDGVGTNSQFNNPTAVFISADGSYALVTDTFNQVIRHIVITTAVVTTLAGLALSSGATDGIGTNSQFFYPTGVSISADGSFALVADHGNFLVRHILISTATVTTLAGSTLGSTNGIGTNSQFNRPYGVSISADDSYALVTDTNNNLLRQIDISTGSVTTLAGSSVGSANGIGTNSQFNDPTGVIIAADNSYALVTEGSGHLIRQIISLTAVPSSTPTGVPSSAPSYLDESWGQDIWDQKRSRSSGYCENQCSGHGNCEMNSNCRCHLNENGDPAWTGADCSLRTCPIDIAWVGSVVSSNNLHPLIECSNKGLCNRQTGECECFTGYDGIACARTTCPYDCYSRGICWPERLLAGHASRLYVTPWDAMKQIGCVCDIGYRGPACELQECPSGPDPLAGYGNEAGRDCSGRGQCDYENGLCSCYPGFFGHRCQHQQMVL